MTQETYDIHALCRAAAELLATAAQQDERVRARPDVRTVRYYQSLGILDPPLPSRGRKAMYGRRHLLQLVATKLLQGQGLSLAQAQRALSGQDDARLQAAVDDATGAAPPPAAPRRLVTAELAPGVLVTLDPAQVPDPDALLARLALALTPGETP